MLPAMLWTIVAKGGPVMIPILVGSVIGFTIAFERTIALLKLTDDDGRQCLARVLQHLRQGQLEQAFKATQGVDHPIAPVLRRGLEQWGFPAAVAERSMEQAAQQQVRLLERWLGGLASVITVEPMLGFLGTITGLIRAFMAWEVAGARVTVSQLAGGIYEAMITTAAGLIIAIPLYLAYNYFIYRIKQFTFEATDSGNALLRALAKHRTEESPRAPATYA